jgi:hypothetical protein
MLKHGNLGKKNNTLPNGHKKEAENVWKKPTKL